MGTLGSIYTQKKKLPFYGHGGLLHWKADRRKAAPLPQPKARGRMQRLQWQHLWLANLARSCEPMNLAKKMIKDDHKDDSKDDSNVNER